MRQPTVRRSTINAHYARSKQETGTNKRAAERVHHNNTNLFGGCHCALCMKCLWNIFRPLCQQKTTFYNCNKHNNNMNEITNKWHKTNNINNMVKQMNLKRILGLSLLVLCLHCCCCCCASVRTLILPRVCLKILVPAPITQFSAFEHNGEHLDSCPPFVVVLILLFFFFVFVKNISTKMSFCLAKVLFMRFGCEVATANNVPGTALHQPATTLIHTIDFGSHA